MTKPMKKLIVLLFVATLSTGCSNDLITQEANVLPETSQALLRQHFSSHTLDWIKVDKGFLQKETYEVKFADGTEVDFDKKGNWKEISSKKGDIPAALIPIFISDYVEKNHPDRKIDSIEREKNGFEIELNNGLHLHFNKQGQMIRMDD